MAVIRNFEDGQRTSVLITTDVLEGKGLNLQFAQHVVIIQKPWNLNEIRQSIARAWRTGQTKEVHAYILHVDGGVDDRARKLQMERAKFEAPGLHRLNLDDSDYPLLFNMRDFREEMHRTRNDPQKREE